MPLFTNKVNSKQWPKVISDDILRHIHNLKRGVYVLSGKIKSKTLLPLPTGIEELEEIAADDKYVLPFYTVMRLRLNCMGAVGKVRHAPEGVTVRDRGWVSKDYVTSHFKFFI